MALSNAEKIVEAEPADAAYRPQPNMTFHTLLTMQDRLMDRLQAVDPSIALDFKTLIKCYSRFFLYCSLPLDADRDAAGEGMGIWEDEHRRGTDQESCSGSVGAARGKSQQGQILRGEAEGRSAQRSERW